MRYTAVVHKIENGYSISFPDFPTIETITTESIHDIEFISKKRIKQFIMDTDQELLPFPMSAAEIVNIEQYKNALFGKSIEIF